MLSLVRLTTLLIIYLNSRTWEAFTQPSERESHVKNPRHTKKTNEATYYLIEK